ncbi:hypothetical protein LIPSTDRAFT_337345, partial [Lipomyces starkeyi NRRL Y-11557]
LYCGICHSDIHQVRINWGPNGYGYPVVPGHEIVGKVFRVGADVSKFKVGDSVGGGGMVDSCQTCATCKNDREQDCESTTFTYGSIDVVMALVLMVATPRRLLSQRSLCFPSLKALTLLEPRHSFVLAPQLTPRSVAGVHRGSKVGVVGPGRLGYMAC